MIKHWLMQLCVRLAGYLGYTPPVKRIFVTDMAPELAERTRFWVAKWDENRAVGGEHKRHQVYSRLLKEFPDLPHYEIGRAIEVIVSERRMA